MKGPRTSRLRKANSTAGTMSSSPAVQRRIMRVIVSAATARKARYGLSWCVTATAVAITTTASLMT